jgi:hypothetical protein
MKAGKSREKAIAAVVTKNPTLQKQYLLATNQSSKAKRLISEKYETAEAHS